MKNPDIHLWLTEGMALYLSNGEEFYKEYLEEMKIPTYEETCTRNPIRFSNCGGYTFANICIEYLDNTIDGSAMQIATNPNDTDSFLLGTNGQKQYNLLYLNTNSFFFVREEIIYCI